MDVKKTNTNKKGSILAYSLMVLFVMMAIVAGISSTSVIERKSAGFTEKTTQSFQVADSGAEIMMKKIAETTPSLPILDNLVGSGLACNSATKNFYGNIGTGKTFEITLLDSGNAKLDCDSAAEVRTIASVKSVGKNMDTARAVEIAIESSANCSGMVADSEGKEYPIVKIGDQCWMAANLNVGSRIVDNVDSLDNGIIEKYCYNNIETNCDATGGLYQWNEMMGYVSTEGAQGICPSGWHIPSDGDWKILEQELGMTTAQVDSTSWRGADQGTQLKVGGSSGFNAMVASGYRASGGGFAGNIYGYLRTSSRSGSSVYFRAVRATEAGIYRSAGSFIQYGFSVRCLRNN